MIFEGWQDREKKRIEEMDSTNDYVKRDERQREQKTESWWTATSFDSRRIKINV